MVEQSGVPKVINWGGQKDLTQSPDTRTSGNLIVKSIKECLDRAQLFEKSKELKLQNVFVPKIYKMPGVVAALKELEIEKGLSRKFVILIENGKDRIVNDYIVISTEKEGLEGENDDTMRISFKNLFSVSRRMSDVVLRYEGGHMPCVFERQGIMKDNQIYIGEFADDEEYALLVVDEVDGVPRTLSLRLPKGWRDAVDENGMLVGATEKNPAETPEFRDQRLGRIKEISKMREQELQDIVMLGIKNHLEKLGLEFNPQAIYAPTVLFCPGEGNQSTQGILDKAGLSEGFPVIFAGKLAGETKPKIYINGAGFSDTYLQVRLIENDPNSHIAFINVREKFDHTIILTEVKTGGNVITLSDPLLKQKNALFIAANPNNNEFRLSSLELPLGWESAFDEGGRLKEPELIRRAKTEIEQLFRQTQGVTGMTQNTILEEKKPTEQLPQLTFAQILAKVKTFPFYRGPAEGKEGIRTAIFGKAKTPAEIKVLDNDILKNGARVSFKFCAFNGNKLEDVFKRNRRVHDRLTLEAFASCFIPGFESKDNLVLKLSLDTTGQTKLEGNLVRWDIGKGGEVDSFPYLRSNLESHELDEIRKIMNDKNITLSFFFSQLETAEDQAKKTSVGEMIEEMRFLRRTAGRDSWETDFGMSGGYTGGDDFYRERRSGNGVKNIEGLLRDETPFPENARSQYIGKPAPSFKDRDPEKRKEESRKYWAHKAERRNRKSKNLGKSKKRK